MNRNEFRDAWEKLVARAGVDEGLEARLMAHPKMVLEQEGIAVPEGIEVRFVEDTAEVVTLVLPPPANAELSVDQLEWVAGGVGSLDICKIKGLGMCNAILGTTP